MGRLISAKQVPAGNICLLTPVALRHSITPNIDSVCTEALPMGTHTGAPRSLSSLGQELSFRTGARMREEALRSSLLGSDRGIQESSTDATELVESFDSSSVNEVEGSAVQPSVQQFKRLLPSLPLRSLRPVGDPLRYAPTIINGFRRLRTSAVSPERVLAIATARLEPNLAAAEAEREQLRELMAQLSPPRGTKTKLLRASKKIKTLRAAVELAKSYAVWHAWARGSRAEGRRPGGGNSPGGVGVSSWGYEDDAEALISLLHCDTPLDTRADAIEQIVEALLPVGSTGSTGAAPASDDSDASLHGARRTGIMLVAEGESLTPLDASLLRSIGAGVSEAGHDLGLAVLSDFDQPRRTGAASVVEAEQRELIEWTC